MKKSKFLSLFVSVHLALIVLHIRQHSLFVRELYRKQRIHTVTQELVQKRQLIEQQLYAFKNPATIKQFATQQLGMRPVALTQIKTVVVPS